MWAFFPNVVSSHRRRTCLSAAVRRRHTSYWPRSRVQGRQSLVRAFFATPSNPAPSVFAPIALRRFSELAKGGGLVSVAAWLESLIRADGIHPVNARARLEEANASGFLRRTTEGSTTDTRHDQHALRVLQIVRGKPIIET